MIDTKEELNNYEYFDFGNFNGVEVLFTCLRISPDILPEGVYKYDIRSGDEEEFATIEPFVLVNHSGTILTKTPFNFDEDTKYIDIEFFEIEGEMSFEEFMSR